MSPEKATPYPAPTSAALSTPRKRAGFLPPRATTLLALGATLSLAALTTITSSNRSYCHTNPHGKEGSLSSWLEKESKIAWWGVLDNM